MYNVDWFMTFYNQCLHRGILMWIVFLLNLLFNGFCIGYVYVMLYVLYNVNNLNNIQPQSQWQIGLVVSLFLSFFGFTAISRWILGLFLNVRKPTATELVKVRPMITHLLEKINLKYKTNYQPNIIKILISDIKEPNVQVFGNNCIIITQGILISADEEEIKSLLAHEMAHIYKKTGIILNAVWFINLPLICFAWAFKFYVSSLSSIFKIFGSVGIIFSALSCIPLVLFLPIAILNWLCSRIFKLSMLTIWRFYEYKADKFVVDLGFKSGLMAYLNKLSLNGEFNNSIQNTMFSMSPSPMKRISRLERISD